MGIELPTALHEARAFVGVGFPSTNESALRGRADEWRGLAQLADQVIQRIESGVDEVAGENDGPTADAFSDFFSSGGGNLGSLRDFRVGCQRAALGHDVMAMTITALKIYVIARLTVVATALNAAKAAGPAAVPFLKVMQFQARMDIGAATRSTTQQLMAG